jgi:hypothetical protein
VVTKKKGTEMAKTTKRVESDVEVAEEVGPAPVVLNSQQEVADCLRLSIYQLESLLRRYPFLNSGVSGKVSGRWKVLEADVFRWFRFVQVQESRHPDSKRMRPAEPPELTGIKGR